MKYLISTLSLAALVLTACAGGGRDSSQVNAASQAASTTQSTNCKVNDPNISGSYSGDCVNGLANGKGYAKGRDEYRGDFKDGNKHGKGLLIKKEGARFEGDFLNDRLNGYGIYNWTSGDSYEGDVVNGYWHGFGVLKLPKGDSAISSYQNIKQGAWEGNYYVIRGIFERVGVSTKSKLVKACNSRSACGMAENKPQSTANALSVGNVKGGDPNKYSTTPGNPSCRFFDGFADNGDGTVTDPRNGLMWKRCAEGFEWNGSRCTGKNMEMNWLDAMRYAKNHRFLGHRDWRLPTPKEFGSILILNNENNECNKADWDGVPGVSKMIGHSLYNNGLDSKSNNSGFFWSASKLTLSESKKVCNSFAYQDRSVSEKNECIDIHVKSVIKLAYFPSGSTTFASINSPKSIRLVRSGDPKEDDYFNQEFNRLNNTQKYVDNRNQEIQRNNERLKKQEEMKRIEQSNAIKNRCNNGYFYTGKIVKFKPAGALHFGLTYKSVVLGAGNGRVSMKVMEGDEYGRTFEVPCDSQQILDY